MVLKSCKGNVCVEPWKELHPSGDVHSLIDSLAPDFDAFYDRQPKVSFTECKLGYLPEFEGPMNANQFGVGSGDGRTWLQSPDYKYRSQWSLWT